MRPPSGWARGEVCFSHRIDELCAMFDEKVLNSLYDRFCPFRVSCTGVLFRSSLKGSPRWF